MIIAERVFGVNEVVSFMSAGVIWFCFSRIRRALFHKKLSEHKKYHTSIFDKNEVMIGEFFEKKTVYPIKAGYTTHKMLFKGREFDFFEYGFGKESGFYIYDNDVQIVATVKSAAKFDNNDTYDVYVVKGFEDFEQMFTLFAVLYDNFYEGNRNEMAKGKKTTYSWIKYRNQFIKEKVANKNWVQENMDKF